MARKKAASARDAGPLLERIMGGPLTFGNKLRSIREGDEVTLEAFARRLDISRANLCDIEQGRKGVSPERALKWAKLLGHPEVVFVQLALQSELDSAGIKYTVDLRAGRKRPEGQTNLEFSLREVKRWSALCVGRCS